MTKKIYYTWQNINQQVAELAHQIVVGGWKPDYIVGITRGGVTPAVMLSHFLSCKMYTLDVRLRDTGDGDGCESNLWMAEDAFGYVQEEDRGKFSCRDDRYHHTSMKNILIVDDINDTGATIDWIKSDWQSGCLPNDPRWNTLWHDNVRFAVLTNNLASPAKVDYAASEVNKSEEDCWLVYPWEEWWKL
jgi:hypoxanthine phosphoribosyltransferase